MDYGLALIADALGRWREHEHRDYSYVQIESSDPGAGSLRLGDSELLAVRLQLGDEKRRVLMEQVWERASKR